MFSKFYISFMSSKLRFVTRGYCSAGRRFERSEEWRGTRAGGRVMRDHYDDYGFDDYSNVNDYTKRGKGRRGESGSS